MLERLIESSIDCLDWQETPFNFVLYTMFLRSVLDVTSGRRQYSAEELHHDPGHDGNQTSLPTPGGNGKEFRPRCLQSTAGPRPVKDSFKWFRASKKIPQMVLQD